MQDDSLILFSNDFLTRFNDISVLSVSQWVWKIWNESGIIVLSFDSVWFKCAKLRTRTRLRTKCFLSQRHVCYENVNVVHLAKTFDVDFFEMLFKWDLWSSALWQPQQSCICIDSSAIAASSDHWPVLKVTDEFEK